MITKIGQAEQVAPGVEGHKVSAHSNQWRGEGEEEQKKDGFAPFRFSRPGGQGQKEWRDEKALEKDRGGGRAGSGCHEKNHPPGFQGVKGKGGQHDPEAAAETKGKPTEAGWKKQGSVRGSPVPSREQEKENGGWKRRHLPDEEVKKGEGQINDKEPKQKRDSGGFLLNPAGNPRVTGPMGNSQDHG
jgi:hypothetical protein